MIDEPPGRMGGTDGAWVGRGYTFSIIFDLQCITEIEGNVEDYSCPDELRVYVLTEKISLTSEEAPLKITLFSRRPMTHYERHSQGPRFAQEIHILPWLYERKSSSLQTLTVAGPISPSSDSW
jgi:hypothetical protein